jgi:peptidoglycan/LPS O-acetylase OafA/YrhL
MGILRLVLAMLVVLGHMDINFLGLHLAVSAVVVFYILAGHVVAKLWSRQEELAFTERVSWFYRDRFLRIYPLYMLALTMSVGLWWLGAKSIFLAANPSFWSWLSNILIVPLNFYMFTGGNDFMLVPPAWSLGAEIQFYILLPLLLSNRYVAWVFSLVTFGCYLGAQLGLLNPDFYGYRLLLGVGFIFMLGVLAHRDDSISRTGIGIVWTGSAIYVAYLAQTGHSAVFNLDVALGIAVGLPLLLLFIKFPRFGRLGVIQRYAGEMSYGVFLFHFPVIWLLQMFDLYSKSNAWLIILISATIAWSCHIAIERPIWRRLRPIAPSQTK